MIIDTHAHYDDEAFEDDRETVLQQLSAKGVEKVINAAASMDGCRRILELIESYDFVYGMQGVHPDDVGDLTETDMDFIRKNADNPKIVAIGEIGLDYHWNVASREVQKHWFLRQIEVAKEVGLPICVHSRDAAADTLAVLKEGGAEEAGGVIHCYSYSAELAKEYLAMGFYFGIGGVVTFKNGRKCKEVVEMLPMDRIILETDAPYLAPEPFRGKRNESDYLSYVAQEIAVIKGISVEEVIAKTTDNAYQLYTKLRN
jgi:TatD DNase family protein